MVGWSLKISYLSIICRYPWFVDCRSISVVYRLVYVISVKIGIRSLQSSIRSLWIVEQYPGFVVCRCLQIIEQYLGFVEQYPWFVHYRTISVVFTLQSFIICVVHCRSIFVVYRLQISLRGLQIVDRSPWFVDCTALSVVYSQDFSNQQCGMPVAKYT